MPKHVGDNNIINGGVLTVFVVILNAVCTEQRVSLHASRAAVPMVASQLRPAR
jgi:hypothetical protein